MEDAIRRRERWNGRYFEHTEDVMISDDALSRAFDAGFDAACDYWENPVRYMDVDINEHQDREREKVVKLLG